MHPRTSDLLSLAVAHITERQGVEPTSDEQADIRAHISDMLKEGDITDDDIVRNAIAAFE